VQCEELPHALAGCPVSGAYLSRTQPDMPTRFRTIKLIHYAVRKMGGTISTEDFFYTVYLPDTEPRGPFTRDQLIRWANQYLP
jgi:hypothetical protein